MTLQTALNHMTVPGLDYAGLLALAARLGCVGVEVRNDIARPLFDDIPAETAGRMARDTGLRLLGISQVQPFNDWSTEREREVADLIATARSAGAESISLIPRNDGTGTGNGERHANLRIALKAIGPMLADAGLVALVEPLGFTRASLRDKREVVETIAALDAGGRFKLVHDTFHHALAGGGPVFAGMTGIVHVSGVSDPEIAVTRMEDAQRGLVDADDRLGNVDQLAALSAQGYDGPVSMECFAPAVHALSDPEPAIRRSFDFMSSQLAERAA